MVEKRVKKFGQGSHPPFSGNARKKKISYRRCSLTDMGENRCNCITGGDHTEFLYPSSLCVCQSNRIKDVRSQFCSVGYILYLPLHSTNEFIDIFGPFTAHKAPCNMDFGGSLINFHTIFFLPFF